MTLVWWTERHVRSSLECNPTATAATRTLSPVLQPGALLKKMIYSCIYWWIYRTVHIWRIMHEFILYFIPPTKFHWWIYGWTKRHITAVLQQTNMDLNVSDKLFAAGKMFMRSASAILIIIWYLWKFVIPVVWYFLWCLCVAELVFPAIVVIRVVSLGVAVPWAMIWMGKGVIGKNHVSSRLLELG